jgi:hypothetical protein
MSIEKKRNCAVGFDPKRKRGDKHSSNTAALAAGIIIADKIE